MPNHKIISGYIFSKGVRGGAVGWGTALQAGKVAGSIPDGVTGSFHWYNPSSRNMALGLTQPLTEISTRNISWGLKAAGAYGWQSYRLHVPTVLKPGSPNLLEPSGPVEAMAFIYFQKLSNLFIIFWFCFVLWMYINMDLLVNNAVKCPVPRG